MILKTASLQDIGLLSGKMGIAILFYLLGRKEENKIYTEFAGDLLDEIRTSLYKDVPFSFDSGLSGIVWGIEYLIQNKFVEGNSFEICKEMDILISTNNPIFISDLSLEKGIHGLLHYVLIHLRGCYELQNNCPFTTDYIKNLHLRIKEIETADEDLKNLMKTYIHFIENNKLFDYSVDIVSFKKGTIRIDSDKLTTYPLGIQRGLAGILL